MKTLWILLHLYDVLQTLFFLRESTLDSRKFAGRNVYEILKPCPDSCDMVK